MIAAIDAHYFGRVDVAEGWAKAFFLRTVSAHGQAGRAVAGLPAASCRQWMAPVRKELGLS